ncbi:GNAT family N-acetyltransferase [Roseicyclus mahoneyensis]|uniref:Ribosomal-protein-alanine N-acetyltransferase n=1 Tax=Roseicyclus mahoneyensis TaxID=164332 RepID=A0A316GKV1_9RHOB|nr:GNAT family N-acetyltransferase [Roseicyclus mahoneyensis]PWK60828.1 ribosomal-protein-alanine N-acetyltransferase [Roseicyclus mahoneyensis]
MSAGIFQIPTLTTERLTLRAPRMSDFDAFAEFRASDRARFVGSPNTRSEAWGQFLGLAGQWAILGYGRWIVADTATDAPLGVVGLLFPVGWPEPEIGWTMFADGEGRGLAHEAALAARAYAYGTAGWTTAISLINPANERSVALGRKMGCHPEGQFVHDAYGTMHIWRHPAPEDLP